MKQAHPAVFYKYLSVQGADAVLSTGRLRWSSPLVFDDPAEFRRIPRFRPSLDQAGRDFMGTLFDLATGTVSIDEGRLSPKCKFLLGSIRLLASQGCSRDALMRQLGETGARADDRFEDELERFVETMLASTRVLCLTVDPDNDAMWERYAENRRGVLLEFRHIPEYSTPLLAARRVTYAAETPIVGSGLDFLLFGDTRELRTRCLESIIYTKKADWQYQREWRAVTWRTDESDSLYGDYRFHRAELASVTVGVGASNSWVSRVQQLVAARYPTCAFVRNHHRASA